MNINELLDLNSRTPDEVIKDLMEKQIELRPWADLEKEYNPELHPVMNRADYPDIVHDDGTTEKVTRVTYDLQRLAAKRMSELCYGIPVKRVWRPENDRQKEISTYIENIFSRARIDSLNVDRSKMLFASCEVMTLWYAVEEKNNYYGFDSDLRLRCRNFSPMSGDDLYPLYDEDGDLVALSVAYNRKVGKETRYYIDAYTKDRHVRFKRTSDTAAQGTLGWSLDADEKITIGKIPAVYCYRPKPIWEDTTSLVTEMEWAMSRNGNYIRRNAKPILGIYSEETIAFGNENKKDSSSRSVLQLPTGARMEYVTWAAAVDSLKFHLYELRSQFFTQLQLPDWSYESMKSTPMSGEARKQLFIDCQLKVEDESGRLEEMHDREVNVVKAFLKQMLQDEYASDIDALQYESEITPYMINEDRDTITTLMTANGGKPVMSQRESIEKLGWSKDVDATVKEISDEQMQAAMNLASIEGAE